MPSFHIPSVPRGLLLPGLDTHEVLDERPADPTPSGSHWLFRPSLYISSADLHMEKITIHNPALLKATSLAGWSVSDRLKRHTYSFPKGSTLSARQSVTLYCCPGKLSREDLDALPKSALMWKNQDGSLRRKEVLCDDGDAVVLTDGRGNEVAMLDLPGIHDDDMSPGGVKGVAFMKLPGVIRSQVLALRTFVLTVCYLRLVCIGLSASYVTLHRDVFLLFAVLAHALDILGRWASSQPGVPMDDFGVVLATMGDRLSALVLLGGLVLLDGDRRHATLFAGMLALDITANWLQMSVASAAGGSRPLAGAEYVRGRTGAPDFVTHLMLKHPLVLTLVSLGNEAFLVWSYLTAASPLTNGLLPAVARFRGFLGHSVCVLLKQETFMCKASSADRGDSSGILSVINPGVDSTSLFDGLPVGGVIEPGEDAEFAMAMEEEIQGDEGTVAANTVWKAVWMALMVCCAVRQLLSCIQALISMSTLSSGVIADAAGQDLQRRKSPRVGRGRSVGRANGGGNGAGSAASRARSRSRVR